MQHRSIVAAVIAVLAATIMGTDRAGAAGRIHRLGEGSTYQAGCFPPCRCPLSGKGPVRGTFKLIPTGFDGFFSTFAVNDVRWMVAGTAHLITGAGTFKIGDEFGIHQQLELDLSVDGTPLQHFDSGLVSADRSLERGPGAERGHRGRGAPRHHLM
jgi:hypothetical protein